MWWNFLLMKYMSLSINKWFFFSFTHCVTHILINNYISISPYFSLMPFTDSSYISIVTCFWFFLLSINFDCYWPSYKYSHSVNNLCVWLLLVNIMFLKLILAVVYVSMHVCMYGIFLHKYVAILYSYSCKGRFGFVSCFIVL